MARGSYEVMEAAGRELRLANPDKVFWPERGWTKHDLAQYYLERADAVVSQPKRVRPSRARREDS